MSSPFGSLDLLTWIQTQQTKSINQIKNISGNQAQELMDKEDSVNTEISMYGQIQSYLMGTDTAQNAQDSLTTALKKLQNAFTPTADVASSNKDVATAEITGTVTTASHTINVNHLAQAQSYASGTFTSGQAIGSTDTIGISIGDKNISIQAAAGDNMQAIADKINAQAKQNAVGATASVISTASGDQLVISSSQTGTDNAIQVTDTAGTTGASLGIAQAQQAKNADFTFDGVDVQSDSNNGISVGGLSLNLVGNGTTNINVNATAKVTDLVADVKNVVASYNQAMIFLAKSSLTDTNGASSQTVQMLQSTLSQASLVLGKMGINPMKSADITPINIPIPASNAEMSASSLTIRPPGQLEVDDKALTAALSQNMSGVQTDLFGDSGAFTQVNNLLQTGTGSIWRIFNDPGGNVVKKDQSEVSSLDTQINTIKTDMSDQITAIQQRYAGLINMISQMQTTSQLLSAEDDAKS